MSQNACTKPYSLTYFNSPLFISKSTSVPPSSSTPTDTYENRSLDVQMFAQCAETHIS